MLALNVAMVFNWDLNVGRSYISKCIEPRIYELVYSPNLLMVRYVAGI